MNNSILLVDDDASLIRVMEYHLREAGYSVITASNGAEAIAKQKESPSAVILTDVRMPVMDGISFIAKLREFDLNVVVVVITGHPSVDVAVDAMKAGAYDFVQKPIEENQLLTIVRKAIDFSQLSSENYRLKKLVADHFSFGNMIGNAPAMQKLYKEAQRVAQSQVTTLIQGETGAGKEVLAKAIHVNSQRSETNFVAINCAAVPANLIESELFGHVKGAFTGATTNRKGLLAEASNGTFFMDEIGDLPLELQPKLLRVLQEKEYQPVGSNKTEKVDIRFICATHRNLESMVREGLFREDLFFRLNVIPLNLPAVRERREDILPLFRHFLKEACQTDKRKLPKLLPEAAMALEQYRWPGNVREIQNIATRCAVLVGDSILPEDLPFYIEENVIESTSIPNSPFDLEEYIDTIFISALEKNNWNQSQTARYLHISRNSLVYRLKRPLLKSKLIENSSHKSATELPNDL